ncbi:MAG: HAD-IA family hydrolase [Beijerinckiaceae bacterium]
MDVVFDIGNVLLRWDPRFLFRKIFEDECRMEHFLSTACANDWILETDTCADFAAAVAARANRHPEYAAELRMFDERWLETLGGVIEQNVAVFGRLRAAGRPVYGLTNYSAQKFDMSRIIYPFLDEFDTVVVSGREGVAKPDARLFRILFERIGRDPHELLFVDDSPRNVAASEELGMAAILYRPGVDLEQELERHGVWRQGASQVAKRVSRRDA